MRLEGSSSHSFWHPRPMPPHTPDLSGATRLIFAGELLDSPPPGFDEAVAISKVRRNRSLCDI